MNRLTSILFAFILIPFLGFYSCKAKKGIISGYVSYPGQRIPMDLKVCAVNIETGHQYCIRFKDTTNYQYHITVPQGTYHVFAQTDEFNGRAYYTEFVKSGLRATCPSHKKIGLMDKK